jgi:hypothetical protein
MILAILTIIGALVIIILAAISYKKNDSSKYVKNTVPIFHDFIESDYPFLVRITSGKDEFYIKKQFELRLIFSGIFAIGVMVTLLVIDLTHYLAVVVALVTIYVFFKATYWDLKYYYKDNYYKFNKQFVDYLKEIELLAYQKSIPDALSDSVSRAPECIRFGINQLVSRIAYGESDVQPYLDFANNYMLQNSLIVMQNLYRMSLMNDENREESIKEFSCSVTHLQNELLNKKYSERLQIFRKRAIFMFVTSGVCVGLFTIMALLLLKK